MLLALLAVATVVVWATGDRQRGGPAVLPVEIVEMGFSRVDLLDLPGEGDGGEALSWGAIVVNTSDRVAHGVSLRGTYRDGDGDTAGSDLRVIDVLLPGQRLGVGGTSYVGAPRLDGPGADVDVTVDRVESWRSPPEGDVAITVDDVWAGHSPDGELAVAFVARSRDDEPVEEAHVRAVFRDADGQIVGGSGTTVGSLQPDEPSPASIATGMAIPDVSTVEVYVFPDADER